MKTLARLLLLLSIFFIQLFNLFLDLDLEIKHTPFFFFAFLIKNIQPRRFDKFVFIPKLISLSINIKIVFY